MSASDLLPPGTDAAFASVEREAVAALQRSRRAQEFALAELEWTDSERTSDAVRAGAIGRLDDTLSAAIRRIGADWDSDEPLFARAADLMRLAGWPDESLSALALRHARRGRLSERLRDATRAFGSADPLDGLRAEHSDLVRSLRAGTASDTRLELGAQDRHDLDWGAAAALRVALDDAGRLTPAADECLRRAVATSLAGHDEGETVDSLAERLARRLSPADLTAVNALLAGHLALFAALLADRAGLKADAVEDWLVAPDPLPAALAMRAAGEAAAEIGGALGTTMAALDRPIAAVIAATERLHGLSSDDARALLERAS